MSQVVIIEFRRDTKFLGEARAILESHKFEEVQIGTFIGSRSAGALARELKELESYKKEKGSSRITIHYGSLSKA